MEYLFIYLLQIANTTEWLLIFPILTTIASGIIWFFCGVDTDFEFENYRNGNYVSAKMSKTMKQVCVTSIIFTLLLAALPTKQTLVLMGGTYIGKQAVKTEVAQKVVKIVNLELDKHIKQLGGQG